MSLSVARYDNGKRVAVPAAPAPPSRRYAVVEDRRGRIAVTDGDSGALVAYASERRAFALAQLLDALELDSGQLAALLGDGKRGAPLLRTITLEHASVCHRCGQTLWAGGRARWNAHTKLTRHVRACPRDVIVVARKRKRAA